MRLSTSRPATLLIGSAHDLEVPAHSGKPVSRIRQKNEETIIKAAEDEIRPSRVQWHNSMNTIALNAGLAQGEPALLLHQQTRFVCGGAEQHHRVVGQHLQYPDRRKMTPPKP